MKRNHPSFYKRLASIPLLPFGLGLGALPQVALADCVSAGTTITCSGLSDGFDDPVNNPGQWALIGPKTINNSGTLSPAPTSISLLGHGFVVNNQAGAIISQTSGGSGPAILITRSTGGGAGVSVNNQGAITSSSQWAIQTGTASGSTSANNVAIHNGGTISQTGATGSSAAAIHFTSATFNATISNAAGATISSATNYGVYNQARNSSAGHNAIGNSGTISGLASGIYTTGDLDTLNNAGSIRAGNGVATTYSAAIGNVGGNIGVLTNTGTIAGNGPGTGYGIDNNGGAIGSIVNSGLISGQGAVDSAGIALRSATSTSIANNGSGTISASGPGGAFSSGAFGINVVGATIPTLTNAGSISGTGAGINVNGSGSIGNLINTGTITGGIRNAGAIASLTNAQSNLAYSGNLPGNYSTIISSPTNYGKLVVTSPSGKTTFGITPSSAIGTGTNTYTAVMTGVTATNIANVSGTFGGGLVSTPWVLKNSSGTTWDLTTNPVVNTPKPVVPNSAAASSLATQLVVAYGAAAGSPGSPGSSSGSNPALRSGVSLAAAVQALTTAQVNGLTNVHAEGYSSNMTIGLEQMRFLTNVVMDRIHKPASDGTSNSVSYELDAGRYAWIDVMAFNGNVNGYNDLAGFGYNAANVTFGADLVRNPTGGLGVFGGIGYSTMTQSSQVSQSFINNTGYGGIYGGLYLPNDFKLSGAAGYIGGSTSAKRNNPGVGDFTGGTASANYGNNGAFAALRIGRSMLAAEKLTLTPYVGASYSQLWSGKVNESGGGDFNYSINSATSYAAVTFVGAEFIRPIAESGTGNPLSVIGFYRFSYNWSANNDSAHSVTANSPIYGSFTQVGANMGPVSNLFGLGLQGDIMKDVSLRVGLVASLNTHGNNFGGGGELRWRF